MKKPYYCENCKYYKQFDFIFGEIIVRMCSLLKLNCKKIKKCSKFKDKNGKK